MVTIKRNLIFSLEKRKKDGHLIIENVPIRLRIDFDGSRLDIYTGYRIDASKWNNAKEEVKNGAFNKLGQNSAFINSRLDEMKMKIQNLFEEYQIQDKKPTKSKISQVVKSLKNRRKTKAEGISGATFFEVFDRFVKENSQLNNWSNATITKLSGVKNHLHTFNPDLKFEDFDENGLTNYLVYLREVKNMKNSTLKKQLGFLKWFLKWSFKKKFHTNDAYQSFRPKIKDSNKTVIFLTEEEKQKIINYEIPNSKLYLDRVRDILIFTCYTGLRHSDVYNLRRSDIDTELDQIYVTTVKTSDNIEVNLNKYSRSILEKYKDVPYENNKALPVISNQKMNDYIKELAELAEINTTVRLTHYEGNQRVDKYYPKYELLGTHVGRRTFICSALSAEITISLIMEWTGHSDYKAMKPYIGIADETKKKAMEKFDAL